MPEDLEIADRKHSELPQCSFIIHISYTMGATNARDSSFSPGLEQGWLNLYSTPAKSAAILGQQWT